MIAGLRWIWLNYGNPTAAWGHITRTGRFNSYPRPGTVDEPTRDPFRRCPVAGGVSYRDDFGERRTVGGYHPHWGNDVIAPIGRPIRAPFDGFAVAHHDGWFAGLWVTVVGERGLRAQRSPAAGSPASARSRPAPSSATSGRRRRERSARPLRVASVVGPGAAASLTVRVQRA